MAQYINKSALVAAIERRIKTNKECMLGLRNLDYYQGKVDALNDTNSFIDTLEVKELPIWEKVSPDTGQTTLYKDGCESYLERFGYRINLKDLDKLPKKNLKAQKGE